MAALVALGAGCRIASESDSLGQPVAAERASSEPGADDPSATGEIELAGVDFGNAVYASACGLGWVEVGAGVGEGPSLDGIYGMEVVDVAVGDLDGRPGDEAAVLVDCLGGDTYSPHLLGFTAQDVTSSGDGPPVLFPSTGGSLLGGHRPVAIESRGGGDLVAELSGPDGTVAQEMAWAPQVISGGELPAVPDSEVHGVVVAHEDPGVLVVSLAPGVGYRLAVPEDLAAIDPDTGTALTPAQMAGRSAKVALDSAGSVAAVELLPSGAA